MIGIASSCGEKKRMASMTTTAMTGTHIITTPLIVFRMPFFRIVAVLSKNISFTRACASGSLNPWTIKYLMVQGFSVPEAQALVNEMFLERTATIRKNGIRKTIKGVVMMCVPVIAVVVMLAMRFFSPQLLAIPIMIGVYGAYCVLKGIIMTVAPKSE